MDPIQRTIAKLREMEALIKQYDASLTSVETDRDTYKAALQAIADTDKGWTLWLTDLLAKYGIKKKPK